MTARYNRIPEARGGPKNDQDLEKNENELIKDPPWVKSGNPTNPKLVDGWVGKHWGRYQNPFAIKAKKRCLLGPLSRKLTRLTAQSGKQFQEREREDAIWKQNGNHYNFESLHFSLHPLAERKTAISG